MAISIIGVSKNSGGILPVTNGGTGEDSLDKTREAMGIPKFISQTDGQLPNIVASTEVWLVIGTRLSLAPGLVLLVHRYESEMKVTEIVKSSGYSYLTNSQGTVALQYNATTANILAFAMKLS